MRFFIREMVLKDFLQAYRLWQNTDGIGLSGADAPDKLELFLERNPHLSFVAVDGDILVGAVLCGHDGRRGYIYHLAVDRAYRRLGIGRNLVKSCLDGLESCKVEKCHIMVYEQNRAGQEFWSKMGWKNRDEIHLMSRSI